MITSTRFMPSRGYTEVTNAVVDPNMLGYAKLHNCRFNGDHIEETPRFAKDAADWTRSTYYDSGSTTEPTNSGTNMIVKFQSDIYNANAYAVRKNGTALQVVRLTTQPASTTLYTGCLLVINNYASLGITLGSTLDIVIEVSTNTFKWQKNGGGYTTGLACSTAGTSIDSGHATVYFMASTGLTSGDTWSWTRTDRACDNGFGINTTKSIPFFVYGTKIYFSDCTNRIMVIENGGCRSVGYRQVYGSELTVCQKHLIVGNFQGFAGTIGTSDLNDLDNFFPTDTNESDVYSLTGSPAVGGYFPQEQNIGLSVIRNTLYAYMGTQIWSSPYLGLPTPFSFQPALTATLLAMRPVSNGNGDYLLTQQGFAFFDGSVLKFIDQPIKLAYDTAYKAVPMWLGNITWAFYDSARHEVHFYHHGTYGPLNLANIFLVYQEDTGQWYTYSADFSGSYEIRCGLAISESLVSGIGLYVLLGGNLNNYRAIGLVYATNYDPLKDDNDGSTYAQPVIETNYLLIGGVTTVKDFIGTFVDAYYSNPDGSFVVTAVSVELNFANFLGSGGTWTTAETYAVATSRDGYVSCRCSGRFVKFRLMPVFTVASNASFGFQFNGLEVKHTAVPGAQS